MSKFGFNETDIVLEGDSIVLQFDLKNSLVAVDALYCVCGPFKWLTNHNYVSTKCCML